ncbi:CCA tRNA nucleotidyltransferase [Maritimibacter sp. UBA3975]|uniref:CCA tRNA nucleotidyltransferase n=1 Tax=Maritimibacter sp. UBA3975 TaxID=1946833 RepID=UPI000C0A22DF|nr:CCA tRNA nucleotidyltransferase [Maritimibacter sp. UBA3975]MAM63417.1 CCA tRNA nucleotidyltransferase [Maritimibacter sp.]|tara:strand:+ start:60615 stop:61778 length:1164 start_codon:yes stop_codon:yes gene_type:complete
MTAARITGSWIRDPAAQSVCLMLTNAGYEAHFVGGCVRNALIGAPISDLDVATNARPETVTILAQSAGFQAIPTGIEHGTVTVVLDKIPFEVTTWRRDVETDGRRAVVAFADRLDEDARRRDFTMNALYATPDGTVVDPLGGLIDLEARRVRFIDDAAARIREDYLRILRFFRFHAWYGDPTGGLDPEALAAISELSGGIETLSRERVGAEMVKLLAAPDPAPAIAVMDRTGVLHRVMEGLDPAALPLLVHFEGLLRVAPDSMRRLAVLGGCDHKDSFRLSKAQDRHLQVLLEHRGSPKTPAALGYKLGKARARDVVLMNAALLESPPHPRDLKEIAHGARAQFPVVAGDLIPDHEGAALGAKLKELEDRWIASGFELTRDDLLRNQ